MKILLLDLETSFRYTLTWGMFKQNINYDQVVQDTHVLCWAAKWLDDDTVYYDALYNYPKDYKNDSTDDSNILDTLWDIVDESDLIIAHNGDRFDVPVMNGRFIINEIPPPSAFKTVDTLKIARRKFRFASNRLDALGKVLGVGQKMEHSGFDMWKEVVHNKNRSVFKDMVDYNIQDVLLLEEVYKKLAPWDNQHQHTGILGDLDKPTCPVCGSDHIRKNGTYAAQTNRYQKWVCGSCSHSMRGRKALPLDKEQKSNILRSI